jgi:multiple sugar transport system ATP-binding protein
VDRSGRAPALLGGTVGVVARIALDGVTKFYPDGTKAVSALDLEIPDGSLLVLVGPSGCGKTTVLLMVAGLEEVTEGTIRIGDQIVNDVDPGHRDVAMVFQNYALYPHMTAYRNMAFGLKIRRLPGPEIDRRVREAARLMELSDDMLAKKPKQLSGGQRQRVAMGRAIVRQPQAFLMDEPLSNLDAKLRVEMRAEISRLQKNLGVTTIYVTHDQTEAMTLGNYVAIMDGGQLQQVGSPEEVYERPANVFVAGFIGSPAMNLVGADMTRTDGETFVKVAGRRLRLPDASVASRPALRAYDNKPIIVGVRPESLEDASLVGGAPADRLIPAVITLREAMGPEAYLHFPVTGSRPVVASSDGDDDDGGATTESNFVARIDARTRAREGDSLELLVDTAALYFFDPETGVRISA